MAIKLSVGVMVQIESRLVGNLETYKTLCRVREGVGLVDLYPLIEHE